MELTPKWLSKTYQIIKSIQFFSKKVSLKECIFSSTHIFGGPVSVKLITLRTFKKKLYVAKCNAEWRLYSFPLFCCILVKHYVKLAIGHAYKY